MTVLITGATSGIGEAFAKQFAKQGYRLILTGRRSEQLKLLQVTLQKTYGIEVKIFKVDFTKRKEVERFCNQIIASEETLKVLINNAGIGHYGPFNQQTVYQDEATIQTNITALTMLTKKLYPCLKRGSRVVQVASTAAFAPGPYMAVYYASKAYVLSLALALREEWKKEGIGVSVLCPGPTATAFQEHAKMEKASIVKGFTMSAKDVVTYAYPKIIQNKAVIIPGRSNRVMGNILQSMPQTVGAKLVKQTQKKVKEHTQIMPKNKSCLKRIVKKLEKYT